MTERGPPRWEKGGMTGSVFGQHTNAHTHAAAPSTKTSGEGVGALDTHEYAASEMGAVAMAEVASAAVISSPAATHYAHCRPKKGALSLFFILSSEFSP